MKSKKLVLSSLLLGLSTLAAPAFAVPMVEIDANGTIVTITDNGAGDINPIEGVIGISQSIGSWTVISTLSVTYPAFGSPNHPYMDLGFSGLLGQGTIQVTFTNDGFTLAGPVQAASSVGGTVSSGAGSTAAFTTLLNGAVISSAGPFGPGAFSDTDNFILGPVATPYTLALRLNVTHLTAGNTTGDYQFEVAEPGSLALFGLAMLGVGLVRRRKLV